MRSQLILLAHGSKDPKWRMLFEILSTELKYEFGENRISLAYMEFSSPSLQEVCASSIHKGVDSFKILPLFMSSGAHVDKDIPKQINIIKSLYPHVDIQTLSPIGESPLVLRAIKSIIKSEITVTN